jgi:putative peptidoglycan lipid II flippase
MVKKILTFLNKEFHGVNEAALLLGGFAFVSQLLGLVRDRAIAHIVGPGPTLDVYYAAFRIPDFLYISIASLASITVLMPFLMERINSNEDGIARARRFLNNIFSAYMLFMVVISIILALCMPWIASHIAPGFSPTQLTLLITTSRIMLLSPIFIGLSNLIGTITQLFKNFFIFSLSPIFYNLGILAGVIWGYPHMGVYGMALGVIIGALLHLLVQIPVVASHGFMPSFSFKIAWREVVNVVKLSAPRTFTLSCNSLATIFIVALASELKAGSISLFTFSYNLQSVPVGIIGISYSVAAFPILVKSFSMKDMDNFITQVTNTARQIIFWSLPIIALIIVLRAQIVRVVLGSGTFSWSDTRLTAAASAIFIISLATQGLVLLFVRGYYAAGNTKKPLAINVFSSVMVIALAFFFLYIFKACPSVLGYIEGLLRVKDVPGTVMLALPLAYTLGSILNFVLIWMLFKKDFLHGHSSGLGRTFMQSALGAVVMGGVAYIALSYLDNIFPLTTGKGVFLQGFLSGIIGISVGVIFLALLKNQELADLFAVLHKKFWRNRVVAPEQGEL